jgi:hypothetical protein
MMYIEVHGTLDPIHTCSMENPEYLLDVAAQQIATHIMDSPLLRVAHIIDANEFISRLVVEDCNSATLATIAHDIEAFYLAHFRDQAFPVKIAPVGVAPLTEIFSIFENEPTGKLEVLAECTATFTPEFVLAQIEKAMLHAFSHHSIGYHYFQSLTVAMTQGCDVILFNHIHDDKSWELKNPLSQIEAFMNAALPPNFGTCELRWL